MKVIENQTFDMERALYGSNVILVKNCAFDGPADGESAFKEGQDIAAEHAVLTAQAKVNKESQTKQSLAQQAIQEICNENILSSSMVDRLIEKVNVFPGNRIEIEYKIQDLFDF